MRARLALALSLVAAGATRAGAQCSPPVQKLISDAKYDEARTEVNALVNKNPANDEALHCMGRIYEAMDKSGDAVDWFEKAVKANEKVSLHHLWLGNALGSEAQRASKFRQPFLARRVKTEFERAVELDPTSLDARHGLIQFYSQAPGVMGGSIDKAKEQAREIQKINAMRGHLEMASLLENKDKDLAATERELAAALAASPDSIPAYNSLAAFYRRQKRYAEAVATYDRLLEAKPDAVNTRLNIGFTLALSGKTLDRGEREVKQWLADPPKNAPSVNVSFAHYVLGMIYEREANKEGARAEYQSAITINSKNEDAKKALAALK